MYALVLPATKVTHAMKSVTMVHTVRIVRSNAIARMVRNVMRKRVNVCARLDGKGISVIGRVMKDGMARIVRNDANVRIRVRAMHKRANARAVPDGSGNCVRRNVPPDTLDMNANSNAIAISTIRLPAMPSMDIVCAKRHIQVCVNVYLW